MTPKSGTVNPRNYRDEPEAKLVGKEHSARTEQLRPNPWNYNVQDPGTFAKLLESMRRFGFTQPIIVRETDKGLEIIDGEHRWRAATELMMPEVRVLNLGVVSDERAKQLTVILNELGGRPDEVRLADLMRDVLDAGVTLDDLKSVMPYTERELEMLVDAVDFSFANMSKEDTRAAKAAEEEEPAREEERVESKPEKATPNERRIVLTLPIADAKDLEAKLDKIHKDPVKAVVAAVERYLASGKGRKKGAKDVGNAQA